VGELLDLLWVEVGDGVKGEAFFFEAWEEFFLEEAFLVFFEATDSFLDGFELFANVTAGGVAEVRGGGVKGVEATDADLEKFIEVGAGDGEEFDAVEEGEVGAESLVEDALVKFEPREFAIDVRRLHGNRGVREERGRRYREALGNRGFLCDTKECQMF